jgi:hypothetical protein
VRSLADVFVANVSTPRVFNTPRSI